LPITEEGEDGRGGLVPNREGPTSTGVLVKGSEVDPTSFLIAVVDETEVAEDAVKRVGEVALCDFWLL
jgi:hypothetical protein